MPTRRVKYLGGSHVRRLEAGEDFGGRLGTPLETAIEWNLANNHVADVDISPEALNLLVNLPATEAGIGSTEFTDVTDAQQVPTSLGQRRWQAVPDDDYPVESYEPATDPRVARARRVTTNPVASPAASSESTSTD